MKHLKYFKEALESNEYYTQITNDESSALLQKQGSKLIFPFEDSELDIIRDCLNKLNQTEIDLGSNDGGVYQILVRCDSSAPMHKFALIYKLEDEYFSIRYNPNSQASPNYFYKADQIEGLIKFLNDIA